LEDVNDNKTKNLNNKEEDKRRLNDLNSVIYIKLAGQLADFYFQKN